MHCSNSNSNSNSISTLTPKVPGGKKLSQCREGDVVTSMNLTKWMFEKVWNYF